MKAEFNKSWKSSKQPRKQRKFLANAPNHIKRTLLGATLDKALRAKYGRRSIEVRKGDEVKVMRGKFAKKQGKVGIVDVKNTRIQIDGIQRSKAGGEKLVTWFHPSNVKIIILNVEDKKRIKETALPKDTPSAKETESKIPKETKTSSSKDIGVTKTKEAKK